MFHACGLYVSCLRPLCFMLAVSMFHACGLYVSCLRSLSTTHGYDKGRIAFWGARKQLGALAVLCGFERRACKHRGCEAGLKHWGWVCAFWLVLFGRSFRGSFFGFVLLVVLFVVRSSGFVLSVVLFVVRASVRAFGRSFRGSFFGFVLFGRSFRGSFFGFVLFGRSFRGSFFCSCFWSFFLWFVLLVRAFGGSYVFFVRCFKSLRGVCGKVIGFLMQR